MRSTKSLSITLPLEMAQMVKEKVSSGEYATESEVIRDGLRTLLARDAAIEKWLLNEVVPTIQEIDDGRMETTSLDEAFKGFDARIKAIAAGK